MLGVQSEVRGRLEATEEASGPTLTVVESTAGKFPTAVIKEIRGMRGPLLEVGDGDGVPVERPGCGLEVGAGVSPFVRRSERHDSP